MAPIANWGKICAGLVLKDRVLFRKHFFRNEITLEPSKEQKLMWCDNSRRVLFCTGRKLSKTITLEAEVIQDGMLYKSPGGGIDEALLWTPNDVHMTPFIDRIFSRIDRDPIIGGCVREKRRGDNTIIEFIGGLRWYARIEGLSGKDTNVVGLRAHILLGDEQAFGCIASGSLVNVYPGGYRRIEDVEPGYKILGWGDRGFGRYRVIDKTYSGKRKVIEISTATRKINVTDNHPFLCAVKVARGKRGNPKTSSNQWSLEWKQAGTITKDDFIVVMRSCFDEQEKSIGEPLAKLIGLWIGDGWYSIDARKIARGLDARTGLTFSVPECDKAESDLIDCIRSVTGKKPRRYGITLSLSSVELVRWMVANGLEGKAATKKIPDWCFLLPKPEKDALIMGLLLSDGYFNKSNGGSGTWYYQCASIELIRSMRELAITSGWRVSNIYYKKSKNNFYAAGGLRKKFLESWTFTLRLPTGEKSERNYRHVTPRGLGRIPIPENLALDRVRQIRDGGVSDTWDLQTECENFVADGILVHNSEAVYKSLIMSAMPNARWIMAGVPNGVRRSIFYQLDQTNLGKNWSRHKYTSYINPLYFGEEARQKLIEDYGGENTHGYKTQVLGEWGEEMFTSFPPGSIAIQDAKLPVINRVLENIEREDLPTLPLKIGGGSIRCKRFILSLDYGFSPDPSILGGFYSDDEEARVWNQFLQIKMVRVPQPYQLDVILHVYSKVFHGQFIGFSSDHLPTVQALREKVKEEHREFVLHASPGSSTTFDLSVIREEEPDLYRLVAEADKSSKNEVNIHNKQLWTEWLRSWMINAVEDLEATRLWIAPVQETISNLSDTTERKSDQSNHIIYSGARDPNDAKRQMDHTVDMLRYAAYSIHEGVKKRDQRYSEDELLKSLGWAGQSGDSSWNAPWDVGQPKRPKTETYW